MFSFQNFPNYTDCQNLSLQQEVSVLPLRREPNFDKGNSCVFKSLNYHSRKSVDYDRKLLWSSLDCLKFTVRFSARNGSVEQKDFFT